MFTTIIVPLDHHEESLRAIKPARVIADATGAELVAASVAVDRKDRSTRERRIRAQLRELGVEVDSVAAYINPYSVNEGLSLLISEAEAPLIVVSTHGHSHTAKVSGSVSEEILHAWPGIPTLLVGPEVDVDSYTLDGPIVACVDPTAESETVLNPVARFSNGLKMDPWVLTVLEPAGARTTVTAGAGAGVPQEAFVETSGVHVIADRLHELGTSEVNWEVLHGKNAAKSIADFTDRIDASIVAMATRNRGGLSRLILGSVAMETVTRATCPVLAVHADADTGTGKA